MSSTSRTSSSARPRLLWADVAKGMCILLVVLHHVCAKQLALVVPSDMADLAWTWSEWSWRLKPVRMPVFFLVSGMFASGAIHRPWGAIRRKLVGPYYLYLVWLVLLTTFLTFETLVPANRPQTFEEIVSQLWLPSTSMWFLFAMAAYLFLARALRRVPPWLVVAAAAAFTASVSEFGITENNKVAVLSHFVYFAAGAYYPQLVRKVAEMRLPVTLLALAFWAALVGVEHTPLHLTAKVLLLSLIGLPFGLVLARKVADTRAGEPLAWLGQRTLQVYVLHLFLISGLAHVPMRMGEDPGLAGRTALVLWPVVAMVLVTGCCLLLHRLLVTCGLEVLFRAPDWLMEGRGKHAAAPHPVHHEVTDDEAGIPEVEAVLPEPEPRP